MTGFILFAACIGFLLGFASFRVFVLIPALLLTAFGVWIGTEGSVWQQSLTGILAGVALQVGYFVALVERRVRKSFALPAKSSTLSPPRFS
jgi:hypothetical protein